VKRADALVAEYQADVDRALKQQQQQELVAGSSSNTAQLISSSIRREGVAVPAVDVFALASSRPEGQISLSELDPAEVLLGHSVSAEALGAWVGTELPQQLQQFGSALWSSLPQPRCCNNAACANLGSISEAKLVAGRTSKCSKCKAAK
jgi:hypothetical protein